LAHTILAIIGDTHIGGSTAIAPPTFEIHNEDTNEAQIVHHNKIQAWLWNNWLEYWEYVKTLAGVRGKHRKNRIVVVHMGDIIDGNHHGTMQIIQDVGDQMLIALDVLQTVFDMADLSYGILGTELHAGKSNGQEVAIYKSLGATDYNQHLALEVDDKIHDFVHHRRAGLRPWTSAAAGIVTEVVNSYAQAGMQSPHFIWGAHNHVIDDSGNKHRRGRAIIIPSWQLRTTYGYRVSSNSLLTDIGGYIVNNGVVDDSRSRYLAEPDSIKVTKI